MKVLIFTPTYGAGPRPETLASVAGQVFSGKITHEVSRYNPYPDGDARNITVQYIRGRSLALRDDYDAMLTVEHDMRIPPHALQTLWDTPTPDGEPSSVSYGVYLFRRYAEVINVYQRGDSDEPIGTSLHMQPGKLQMARAAGIVPVTGLGFGCTLIRRDVLERIQFQDGDKEWKGSDVMFSEACLRADIGQWANFAVECGHWNGRRWLMPFEMGERPWKMVNPDEAMVAVRANRNITVRIRRESVGLIAGRKYEIPESDVDGLIRTAYVTVLQ